jgi:hypothetical protein
LPAKPPALQAGGMIETSLAGRNKPGSAPQELLDLVVNG